MKPLLLCIVLHTCVWAGTTTALYNPASPTTGPFPANALTTPDTTQKTGLRINLPSFFDSCDVTLSPSVCSNTSLLNQLDGFSVNPRIMVCFSAPVDSSTVQTGIQIVPAGGGASIAINQIIIDPNSNCVFAKPNQVLNQQSQYLLVATDSVHDSTGKKVKEDDAFANCLKSSDTYCEALEKALQNVPQQPASANKIVTASLFTTMSATTWLENARAYVDATEPPAVLPAGVSPTGVVDAGLPTCFNLSDVTSITWTPQESGNDLGNSETITPSMLSGVGKIAFGFFMSPLFLNTSDGTIHTTPTANPIAPSSIPPIPSIPVSFHLFIPSSKAPSGGFPVAIYGHGLGDNQFGAPSYIASTLALHGIATLAFEITGHGYSPFGTVEVAEGTNKFTLSTPGRGVKLSSVIGSTDGCIVPGAFGVRDCGRQTAVDLFALVQTIRETQGLGYGLNPSAVYYVGQSFGGTYGTLFHAVEPNVKVAVLNGDGGPSVDVARLAITGRPLGIEYLKSVNPALLNVDSGLAPPEPYFHDDFNDNYVFRDVPPVINTIGGALADQAAFEAAEWLGMVGDPLSFAPHLITAPLAGVPSKSVLFQFGLGDLEVPNPAESAVVRAANAQSTAWFLRFDEVAGMDPSLLGISMAGVFPLPILPHRVLSNPTIFGDPGEASLAIAEQQQVASYFSSGGTSNPDPNTLLEGAFAGKTLFETFSQIPSGSPTTQLNFLQIPK